MIRPGYFAAALSCSSRPRPGTPPDKFTVAAIPFRSISSIARGIASGARWECTSILVYREERQDSASSSRMTMANRRRAAKESGMADFRESILGIEVSGTRRAMVALGAIGPGGIVVGQRLRHHRICRLAVLVPRHQRL